MFNNNSISIAVSDDDNDEPGRMRARIRRKRKKPGVRFGETELTQRLVRLLVRYWALLIFVLALWLLLFEAMRIGRKVSSGSSGVALKKAVGGRKEGVQNRSMGNLNRLDSTTRVVGGVRERCLKLLPLEELQQLDIPAAEESNGPIKNVLYMSGEVRDGEGDNATFSRQVATDSRFNLFTGNQSFEQREESFQVKETVQVHCGFCSESGGFKLSEKDKNFMESCIAVVATCAFGGGDDLYQPIGMTDASIQKVSYVAFWDEVTLVAQELEGHRLDVDGFIGKWRIVVVKNLPFADQRLNGKIPKMLAHRLFPHAKYSIWVDSKSQFRRDPLGVLEALLWRLNSGLAISEHGARSSVYDEAKAVVKKNKATPQEVEVQLTQYKKDGLPKDKRFHGKKALVEASVIVREHTPATNLFMCLWFNEVVRFTSRDQLSFPYVRWRLGVLDNINIFPVCTRKDLVNSMGHLRKAKPLIS